MSFDKTSASSGQPAASGTSRTAAKVKLAPGGIDIGGELVPLYAGSVHYWRLDPGDWRACLQATRALGLRLVDVYVPWAVHELSPGVVEVGATDPRRDVAAFLRIAHEVGLYAIVRPGPHINAELTCFGIPERVIWDPSCQARSPADHAVMLPMVPYAFPVPSYASDAFHDEAARWFQAVVPTLAPLVWPDGPIVMLQIDNEGALYFRDGAYDQDYHPDAVTQYRRFLRDKYRSIDALEAAYGTLPEPEPAEKVERGSSPPPPKVERGSAPPPPPAVRFATLQPPTRFDATAPKELARHLDWSEFHEHLLATALGRFAKALTAAGMPRLPTSHNMPLGQDATPLNAARMTRAVDLVGLDYYHAAGERSRAIIARRTSELAVRSEGLGVPAFAAEMGAGFPPFFPPLDERDSAFTMLTGLAYGLRGFNVYMAVERDRWIGAPIDRRGRARPFAAFWRKLCTALERVSFHTLRRCAPVRLLIPRSERRLTRVMHAFGPLTGVVFSVIGAGARESCLEDDLGLGYPLAVEADGFVRLFEAALEARGVPFAHIGGEDREVSLDGARWIVCATSGGMNPALFERLAGAARSGVAITIGPRAPTFDGCMRPLDPPYDLEQLGRARGDVPLLLDSDPGAADLAVARAIDRLELPTSACDPDGVFATVHEDAAGMPRVLFLINPSDADVEAQVTVLAPTGRGAITALTDLLDDSELKARGAGGHALVEARLKPRTVRMLALR